METENRSKMLGGGKTGKCSLGVIAIAEKSDPTFQ